jgi:thiamine biosynthesis lipoprotein ApbE
VFVGSATSLVVVCGLLSVCTPDGITSVAPSAQRAAEELVLVARARYVMGAPLELRTYSPVTGRDEAARALDAALDEVERLDAVLSNWKQDSELSRLNRAAAVEPVACSLDLFTVLEASLAAWAATGGAFDPGLEAWTHALGLHGTAAVGETHGLETTRPAVEPPGVASRARISLDRRGRTVHFSDTGTAIDLGGIGKGYALDAAGQVLRRRGIANALLNFGGQVLALGAPPDEEAWIAEVADPTDRFRPVLRLRLRNASAATSTNTERGVWKNGEWIGHVLDPRSGRSAPFPGSATAVAAEATRADAYATALLVMGPVKGLEWAEERNDVAAAFLGPTPSGQLQVTMSSSFKKYHAATDTRRAAR